MNDDTVNKNNLPRKETSDYFKKHLTTAAY
jgi:hypothetical protein